MASFPRAVKRLFLRATGSRSTIAPARRGGDGPYAFSGFDSGSGYLYSSNRTRVCRLWSGFEGGLVHSPDRFFPEAVLVGPPLLARRFSCGSVSFVQQDRFGVGERGETIQTF